MNAVDGPSPSPDARVSAATHQLWHRLASAAPADTPITIIADRVYAELRVNLGRWIGVEGFHALLDRSLRLARDEHTVLSGLGHLGGEDPIITAAVKSHGADRVVAALIGLLSVLTGLLGRIIGMEMAIHLIDQVGIPSPRGIVGQELEVPLND